MSTKTQPTPNLPRVNLADLRASLQRAEVETHRLRQLLEGAGDLRAAVRGQAEEHAPVSRATWRTARELADEMGLSFTRGEMVATGRAVRTAVGATRKRFRVNANGCHSYHPEAHTLARTVIKRKYASYYAGAK